MSSKYNELIKKYPYLFSISEYDPIRELGIECDYGWYYIIEAVCENISARYRSKISSVKYLKKEIENKNFNERFTEEKSKEILNKTLEELQEEESNLPKFEQIKEKFATLRIYTDKTNDYISGVIDMAESMSKITCEVCGNHGKIYPIRWHKTLCQDHAKERYGEKALDFENEFKDETH